MKITITWGRLYVLINKQDKRKHNIEGEWEGVTIEDFPYQHLSRETYETKK